MSPLALYYRRRVLLALGSGLLFAVIVGQWSSGAVLAGRTIAISLWVPRSGRYVIDREGKAREDERSRAMRARAAEIGFGVVLAGVFTMWFVIRTGGGDSIPVAWPAYIAVAGLGTQILADLMLNRRSVTGG